MEENYMEQNISFGNSGKLYELHIIFEDASSGNAIMVKCVKKFAEINNIKIQCCIIIAKGVSNIPKCIRKYSSKMQNCMIVYDELTQDTKSKLDIDIEVRFAKHLFRCNIVIFKPRCIEECALSFKYLTDEIKNSTIKHKQINTLIHNYFITGNDYIAYEPIINQYTLGGNKIQFSYYSKYLKENVTNLERLLADILAQITFENPYEFIKRANECWYEDCITDNGYCVLANILGIKRPNSKVSRCNHLLLNSNKIDMIISNSLFACFYDGLNIIFGIEPMITNSTTLKEMITCYI